jgi:hypothetical protein
MYQAPPGEQYSVDLMLPHSVPLGKLSRQKWASYINILVSTGKATLESEVG